MILLTGGTGYIGPQLVHHLKNDERFKNHRIIIFDSLRGRFDFFENPDKSYEIYKNLKQAHPDIELIIGDIRYNTDSLHKLIDKADYVFHLAAVTGADDLREAAATTARQFYLDDTDAPLAYEPLGWDFLSPGLVEADLMRRVLDSAALSDWLDGFLPDLTGPPHDAVLSPVEPDVETGGGGELHLVGLNLSRAWCLAGVAAELDGGPTADRLAASARDHAERGLADAFVDDYTGTHWLSSFALYLVTRAESGIAPAAGE